MRLPSGVFGVVKHSKGFGSLVAGRGVKGDAEGVAAEFSEFWWELPARVDREAEVSVSDDRKEFLALTGDGEWDADAEGEV